MVIKWTKSPVVGFEPVATITALLTIKIVDDAKGSAYFIYLAVQCPIL